VVWYVQFGRGLAGDGAARRGRLVGARFPPSRGTAPHGVAGGDTRWPVCAFLHHG
jgi:hypothetical protein